MPLRISRALWLTVGRRCGAGNWRGWTSRTRRYHRTRSSSSTRTTSRICSVRPPFPPPPSAACAKDFAKKSAAAGLSLTGWGAGRGCSGARADPGSVHGVVVPRDGQDQEELGRRGQYAPREWQQRCAASKNRWPTAARLRLRLRLRLLRVLRLVLVLALLPPLPLLLLPLLHLLRLCQPSSAADKSATNPPTNLLTSLRSDACDDQRACLHGHR